MAELEYARALGARPERVAGSNPAEGTRKNTRVTLSPVYFSV